jgi:Fe-S cluster assembly protein SufD
MADIRPIKTNAEVALANIFTAAKPVLKGSGEIAAARDAAFESFSETGLPHRRIEAWKYTDLRTMMREAAPLASPPDAAAKEKAKTAGSVFANFGFRRIVVVDGTLAADLSDLADLDAGLTIASLADALALGDQMVAASLGKVIPTNDPALALNTALMGDGVVVKVAPGAAIGRPIHVVFVTTSATPVAMFPRSLVVVGAGASLSLMETYEGPDESAYQVNAALELVIGDNARLDRVKIVKEGSAAIHVATLLASYGAKAEVNDFAFVAGGAVIRNQLFVKFAGEGGNAGIRGVNLLAGKQHADNTLVIDHAAAGCQSRELFKSVLDGSSCGVFQGRITVKPGAQQTDARMMTRALLLSETAEADNKPELEIFADDVQCGHGSTTGALDEELKFYMMARGIPAREAEALLIQAFVGEAVDPISHEGIREALMQATASWVQDRR